MLSKRRHVAKSDISPVLFMTVDGEPMSFFLRPSPNKVKLQPLITAGGGLLCNVQRSGAILLIDPEERGSVPETSKYCLVYSVCILIAGIYIKIVYLYKSPDVCLQLLLGRAAYTPEEDAAILSYVRNHMTQTGGNRLWQEMEKKCVTSHSWQSMKHRYKTQLAKKLSGVEEVKTIKEKTKVIYLEGVASSISPIAVDSTPANVEDQTCSSLQEEVQHVKPQTDVPAAESTQAEIAATETSGSPQPKGLCLDSQTDVHPIPAESTEPKRAKAQSVISPQKGTVLDSPMVEQPQRRITRRQLVLEPSSSPETYGKKLRSSSTSAEKPSSSPQPLKKTKSAVKSPLQKDSAVDQSPSKRAKGKTVAAVEESQREESEEATVSERPPSVSVIKALMKTSGDIPAALDLLLDPSSVSGPFWNRYDDGLLLSADAVLRQQLQEKYGEESLAKRIVFLELEG
uniref:Telomeric repeat-binding factor 2-interacting protein 1 n=1 Tax=Monopterus albus TaxID=43700 RepID=A0A3Q3QEP6_MONAL